jgi:hypothetical protein
MTQKFKIVGWLPTTASILTLFTVMCSMPSDTKETAWRTQITLPIGVTDFSLTKLMTAGFNNFDILGASGSARPGDTLIVAANDSMTMNFNQQLFNLDSAYLKEKLGASTIQTSDTVAAPMTFDVDGKVDVTIPFHTTSTQTLKNIFYAEFDSTCPPLPVQVTNASTTVILDNLTIGIMDNGQLVTNGHITTLSPGASETIAMPMAGAVLDSVIMLDVSGTIRGNGATVSSHEGLFLKFSLNGMVVSKATILDSLLNFTHRFEKALSLSDTFNIDYVDFDTAIIEYTIMTTAPIMLRVEAELRDLWDISFCKQRDITTVAAIAPNVTASDSANPKRYLGRIIADTLGRSGLPQQRGRLSFGSSRLFAKWDTITNKSMSYYKFTAAIIPAGRRVTIAKTDRFEADMQPVRFPFVALSGKFQYEMRKRGAPFRVQTSLGWGKSIVDSLRGKLQFKSATAPLSVKMIMANSSLIDSVLIAVVINNPQTGSTPPCTSLIGIGNMTNNTAKTAIIDLTELINGFPDSLVFSLSSTFPARSRLFLTNERDPITGEYPNSLLLGANTSVAARIPLDWKFSSTAVVILEDSRVAMNSSLKDFTFMRDREVSLVLRIKNESPLAGVLYGIAAADADGKALLSLPDDQVDPAICATQAGKRFINLLGNSGVGIPKRDPTDTAATLISIDSKSTLSFDEQAIARLFGATTLHIRWKLVLPAKEGEAMRNGDKISISSSFNIKGTMTTHMIVDSLNDL